LNFGLTLEAVAEEYRPNFLCNYLYELAGHFTRFYENCPVLKPKSRAAAAVWRCGEIVGAVLKQGLDVLALKRWNRCIVDASEIAANVSIQGCGLQKGAFWDKNSCPTTKALFQ